MIRKKGCKKMKKKTLFFISLLSFGTSLFYSPNIVSAKEFNLEEIETTVNQIGDITVEETIVPNELADEWAQINGWEEEEIDEVDENYKLTENSPYIISPYGASPPYFSYWNVSTKGEYQISGSFLSTNALYTNYYFNGTTNYQTKVRNHSSYRIGFQAKDTLKTYYSTTIPREATLYTTIKMTSSSNNFYLKFFPAEAQGGSVSGYIRMQ